MDHPFDNLDTVKIIQAIAGQYAKDWEKHQLGLAKELLTRTWSGIPLPVLSVCGRGTQEIRYSTYLGYFLDPSRPHGLGKKYLDQILLFMGHTNIDTYHCKTENEKTIGYAKGEKGMVSCDCDIVISTEKHVVFIEQKINSAESNNPKTLTSQLIRYDEAIDQNQEFNGKSLIRIFLTPTGKQSQRSPNWECLSYANLVEIGLKTLNTGGLSGIARANLIRFLMDLLLGPFKKAEDEIQRLVCYAEKSVWGDNFSDRLHFDQMVSSNKLLVELLLEG